MRIAVAGMAVCAAAQMSFGQVSFRGLGTLAGFDSSEARGISPDGTSVIGVCWLSSGPPGTTEVFRWSAPGPAIGLGYNGIAEAVSNTGVVIGTGNTPFQAFRLDAGQVTYLGCFGGPGPWCSSGAFDVSPGGDIVVGQAGEPTGSPAFRWTAGTGMVSLGFLEPPGASAPASVAFAVSADTTTIVGDSTTSTSAGFGAFRWTQSLGMRPLGDLAGGGIGGSAADVSADGSVVVGTCGTPNGPEEAFRWALTDPGTGVGVMTGLGDLPGGDFDSVGRAVSGDGGVVVGVATTAAGPRAFVWTQAAGMRDLEVLLTTVHHLDLTGWTLWDATDISGDGTRIVGRGAHNGVDEAWLAVLPRECYANCDGSTLPPVLNVSDFSCFLNRIAAGDTYANCDGSTVPPVLNVSDFSCYLNAFAAGCP